MVYTYYILNIGSDKNNILYIIMAKKPVFYLFVYHVSTRVSRCFGASTRVSTRQEILDIAQPYVPAQEDFGCDKITTGVAILAKVVTTHLGRYTSRVIFTQRIQ